MHNSWLSAKYLFCRRKRKIPKKEPRIGLVVVFLLIGVILVRQQGLLALSFLRIVGAGGDAAFTLLTFSTDHAEGSTTCACDHSKALIWSETENVSY